MTKLYLSLMTLLILLLIPYINIYSYRYIDADIPPGMRFTFKVLLPQKTFHIYKKNHPYILKAQS